MDYTNTPIQELNSRIDMIEMAVALGYQEDRAKSYRGGKCFVLGTRESHDDRIFIQPSRTAPGMQHFSSVTYDNGGNGAAMLVKHALQRGFIADPLAGSQDPRASDINRKIAKVMCNYLAIPDEDRQRIRTYIPELRKSEPFREEAARQIMAPAINPSIFARRGIRKETFNSPSFKGTWCNVAKGTPGYRRESDLCFPCYRKDGTIGGLNFRYFDPSRSHSSTILLSGSEKSNTVWHSNIPERIDRILIAESEFDCMAHFQLNAEKSQNTLYFSHQGNLIPSQIDCMIDIMVQNADRFTQDFKLLLGADNDLAGSKYDLQILKAIAELKRDTFRMELPLNHVPNSRELLMGEFNDPNVIVTTITVSSEKYDRFKSLTSDYINENTNSSIKVMFSDDLKTVNIARPVNDKFANAVLCEILTNSNLLISNVRREKAVLKDWNDDLKLLNRINDSVWSDFKLPKAMDYKSFRELSQDYNFDLHVPELKTLLKDVIAKHPDHFHEVPKLVEELRQSLENNGLDQETLEKVRQAKAMFRRS